MGPSKIKNRVGDDMAVIEKFAIVCVRSYYEGNICLTYPFAIVSFHSTEKQFEFLNSNTITG